MRALCYKKDRSYSTYKPCVEQSSAEVAANTLVCIVHQTNYLLDQQLRALENEFLYEGGFTEKLYRARTQMRGRSRTK
jgi:four helix bundle suffix protein